VLIGAIITEPLQFDVISLRSKLERLFRFYYLSYTRTCIMMYINVRCLSNAVPLAYTFGAVFFLIFEYSKTIFGRYYHTKPLRHLCRIFSSRGRTHTVYGPKRFVLIRQRRQHRARSAKPRIMPAA